MKQVYNKWTSQEEKKEKPGSITKGGGKKRMKDKDKS